LGGQQLEALALVRVDHALLDASRDEHADEV
jgi:hypothetical protein